VARGQGSVWGKGLDVHDRKQEDLTFIRLIHFTCVCMCVLSRRSHGNTGRCFDDLCTPDSTSHQKIRRPLSQNDPMYL
jgi:hypothetical protein